jgi:hypothetical protein
LRRDFKTVLMLVKAHALLHQASRVADEAGRIVAVVEDYAQVRHLIGALVAEGAGTQIRRAVREVVETVATLLADDRAEVRQSDLAKALRLDKSVVSRRVAGAIDAGLLRNLEERKGRPARLVLGEPIPDDLEILPRPERLHGCGVVGGDTGPLSPLPDERLHGCAVVEGDDHPSPPAAPDQARPNAFQCTGFAGPGANRCARCGAGDRPDDPLLPFGVEPDHSWQHMACWNEARGPGQP